MSYATLYQEVDIKIKKSIKINILCNTIFETVIVMMFSFSLSNLREQQIAIALIVMYTLDIVKTWFDYWWVLNSLKTKYFQIFYNVIFFCLTTFMTMTVYSKQDFEDSKNEQQLFVLFIYPSSVLTITLRFYVCALFEIHSLYYV